MLIKQSLEEQKRRRKERRKRWWDTLDQSRKVSIYQANAAGVRNNSALRLKARIRRSVRKALNRIRSSQGVDVTRGAFKLLGYSPEELRAHLSFWLGKDCEECGLVRITLEIAHIDHKTPLVRATTIEEVVSLNRLSNLRLICGPCNIKKSSKFPESEA